MDEIFIGVWQVYFSTIMLGIMVGFFIIVVRMAIPGKRGGVYKT